MHVRRGRLWFVQSRAVRAKRSPFGPKRTMRPAPKSDASTLGRSRSVVARLPARTASLTRSKFTGLGARPGAWPTFPRNRRSKAARKVSANESMDIGGRVEGTSGAELWASEGEPHPLGPSPVTRTADGATSAVNFAVVSENASSMSLCIASVAEDGASAPEILHEFPMRRTKNTFHVCVHDIQGAGPSGLVYGVRVEGEGGWETAHRWDSARVLLDPYAPLVYGRRQFGIRDAQEGFQQRAGSMFWGAFEFDDPSLCSFDWGKDYAKPQTRWEDTVIYEMSVRLFTSDESSFLPEGTRGTFEGLRQKIPHLKSLGVTCVELLPIFEYDELEFRRFPNPRDHMTNVWGYSHISFFAPMSRFAKDGGGPARAALEFKELVRDLHAHGIEVVLDVVYNHTAEGGDTKPYLLSFRGIDSSMYYMQDPDAYEQMLNYSGCGNTVNANHPVVTNLILDSLRHWVEEYHVDGFRFDLASALCRNPRGTPLRNPPLIGAIAKDPILSKVKLISEPWDCGGLYQVGTFPNWDVWAEWNGKYRDDVRRFIKGDPGMKSAFATRLAGSADLYNYNRRKPYHSVNFVIAHDGFTLNDLVSYDAKHNEDNGEESRDGSNDNFSWNCGVEGPTSLEAIQQLRVRQRKNFHLALMVSQGTPMVLMGDEYGRTTAGNNNTYGLDRRMNYFRWDQLEGDVEAKDYHRFYAGVIHYRRGSPLLGRSEFLGSRDITWHESDWENDESCFLSFTLHGEAMGTRSIYVAFNAHDYWVENSLPRPRDGKRWHRVVDTNLSSPRDFDAEGARGIDGAVYRVAPYSAILLEEK